MMHIGRIIATALLGFLFLLFVAVDLVIFGVIALNSVIVTLLPLIGLVGGGVLGALAGRRQAARSEPSTAS
jgi:hypothetical protein